MSFAAMVYSKVVRSVMTEIKCQVMVVLMYACLSLIMHVWLMCEELTNVHQSQGTHVAMDHGSTLRAVTMAT